MQCTRYPFNIVINEENEGRLDVVIHRHLIDTGNNLSRSVIKHALENSPVFVNGKAENRPGATVKIGSRVNGEILIAEENNFEPYALEVPVLYEDEHCLVVDKPAGLPVHPGAGTGNRTLVNALSGYLSDTREQFDDTGRPGIVHRLDKDTTGIMVIARNRASHAELCRQFQQRSIRRVYDTLVALTPRLKREVQINDSGVVKTRIGRHPTNRIKFSVCSEGGKEAETQWYCKERFLYAARLHVVLKTGRTHQIRVHMQYLNSPVIGDPLYGDFEFLPAPVRDRIKQFGRQTLHARVLGFTHPITGKELSFETEPPEDHLELVKFFKNYE